MGSSFYVLAADWGAFRGAFDPLIYLHTPRPGRPGPPRHSVPHHLLSGDRVRVRTHIDGGNKAHDLHLRC